MGSIQAAKLVSWVINGCWLIYFVRHVIGPHPGGFSPYLDWNPSIKTYSPLCRQQGAQLQTNITKGKEIQPRRRSFCDQHSDLFTNTSAYTLTRKGAKTVVQSAEFKRAWGCSLKPFLHTDLVLKNLQSMLIFNFLQGEFLNACLPKIIFWIIHLQNNFSIE